MTRDSYYSREDQPPPDPKRWKRDKTPRPLFDQPDEAMRCQTCGNKSLKPIDQFTAVCDVCGYTETNKPEDDS